MKILFLNHNLIGRGTFWRCLGLGRALAGLGHEVTLVTASDRPQFQVREELKDGVRLVVTPRWFKPGIHDGGFSPLDILYRCGWILGRKFDIIHAFAHRPNVAFPWTIARWLGRGGKYFTDWDDWWTRGGITTPRRKWAWLDTLEAVWFEERLPRRAMGVSVASTVLRNRALELGIPLEKILVVPQGSDLEAIRPEDRSECRKQLRIPSDAPVINFVGFAVWDVETLLKAFSLVRRSLPGALLQIIGYDKDGALPRLVAASPDREAILERGQVPFDRLSLYLGAGNVQALPMADRLDNRARWPIKLGDYLASGRPVAMQDVGDGASLVRDFRLGRVTGLSPEEFARGILDLLERPEEMEAAGTRARWFAEARLRWERRAIALLEFYRETENRF